MSQPLVVSISPSPRARGRRCAASSPASATVRTSYSTCSPSTRRLERGPPRLPRERARPARRGMVDVAITCGNSCHGEWRLRFTRADSARKDNAELEKK